MRNFNPQDAVRPAILATDLDGTLIPLENDPAHLEALAELRELRKAHGRGLIFATGRDFASTAEAMEQYGLPDPDWIVCDVGTAIYHRDGESFAPYTPYETHLGEETGGVPRETVEALLESIEPLAPQPPENQKPFKISYTCPADAVETAVAEVNARLGAGALPFAGTGSVDPFTGSGLLDVLPRSVSKAYALLWLATHADFSPDEVLYAGDSGNDLAALASGFRAVIVANCDPALPEKARRALERRGLGHRLYLARATATSGVLEGCRHFGLFPNP